MKEKYKKTRTNIINISKHLKLICTDPATKRFAPAASSLSDIKKLVKGKIVKAEPEMDADDLLLFLSNIQASFLGVQSNNKELLSPKKACIGKIKQANQTLNNLKNKDSLVLGGCFNGIHKGHRNAIKKLYFYMKSKYENPAIVILLSIDNVIVKKNRERGGSAQVFVQKQLDRAKALSCIPYVDTIILLPKDPDREYFQLLKKIDPKELGACEDDTKTIQYCYEHKKNFAKILKKEICVKVFPLEESLSCYDFFKNEPKPLALDISKQLALINNSHLMKQKAPQSTTLEEIKLEVKDQIIGDAPGFEAEDLNNFLSKLGSKHIGVLSKKKGVLLEPKKSSPAKIISDLDQIPDKDPSAAVVVTGGCFNGVHKGHRFLFRYIKFTAEKLTKVKAIIIVLLEPINKLKEKAFIRNSTRTGFIQTTDNRALVLSKIPGVDVIIKLSENFKDYQGLINKLKPNFLAACEEEAATLKYMERQKKVLRKNGLKTEIIKVPAIKKGSQKLSSSNFFNKDKI